MFGRPIGQNQGIQFPIARAYAQMRAAELMVHEAAALYEAGQGLRRRSQHGEDARRRRLVGGRRHVRADPWRLRLRRGIRHRAQVPRDAALFGGADLDQPDPVVSSPSTCSACRGRIEWRSAPSWPGLSRPSTSCSWRARGCSARPGMTTRGNALPLKAPRRLARTGRRGADLLVPARGRRRARHQDRAAGGRFRARLRHAGDGRERLFRLAQPRQGVGRPRPDQGRRQGAAGEAARQGRRVHPEPQARRGRQARLRRSSGCARDYPRLICCSISGFGESGPYAARKSYDLLVQAESGLASVTGGPEAPARVGVSVTRRRRPA